MIICLERGAHLHTAQLMPLPLIVSCFSKIQIGFTFLVLANKGSPGKGPLNGCVCMCISNSDRVMSYKVQLASKFLHSTSKSEKNVTLAYTVVYVRTPLNFARVMHNTTL